MNPTRWERMQAMFHRAAELDPSARARFLDEQCRDDATLAAEVERMLDADGRASLLDRDVTEVASDVFGGALLDAFRESSPYRILKLLGEGGMGAVYLAERTDLGNLVAIKILRDGWLSPERRGRFTAEQRMLARFNHPSIARLYDASTLPDGTPWFVMEYVDGLPITEYGIRNHCSFAGRVRLIRAVAEAVQYAHERGVIHRDLKPSNILVKSDGAVRLVDFGIAKQLDGQGRPLNHTRTALRPMTTAYASPEQLRGEPIGVATDVYSLGVVLYEVLTGKLPYDLTGKTAAETETIVATAEPLKPSSAAPEVRQSRAWRKLDALCLTAIQKNPEDRFASVAAFIRDIEHYLNDEPLEARPDSWPSSLARFARRNRRAALAAVALLAVAGAAAALTLAYSRRIATPAARTVAVLPFENAGEDHSLDFLSHALAEEVWRTLDHAPSVTLRSPAAAENYAGPDRSLPRAGRDLRVATIASGHYLKSGDRLQVTMDLTDVATNRLLWSDMFDVPAENMVAMQAQVAAKTRRALAPALSVTDFAATSPRPASEEAYKLYLQSRALPDRFSKDPEIVRSAIAMLTRSVALDPAYGPAWAELAHWYTTLAWWGNGGADADAHAHEANLKAAALDPDNPAFSAGDLYQRSSASFARKSGAITKAQAYRQLEDWVRRRPDNARLHFFESWILRDVGLLDEAAQECEASILIDAQEAGARSCGVTFMQRGDYARAMDYLRLDADSEVSKAMSIDLLLRQGKASEALDAMAAFLPEWGGYNIVRASLERHPPREIAALALDLKPVSDPEVNYFSSAHLAYAHQTEAALAMLKATIDGGYCSFPAANSDPLFEGIRAAPEFAYIESAGVACRSRFIQERGSAPR